MWGWDHPSVDEDKADHAKLAKAFGVEHGLEQYTSRKVECTEDDAWSFTALSSRLANANGAFRGTAGPTQIYMTFGEISLTKTELSELTDAETDLGGSGQYNVLEDEDAEWFINDNFLEQPGLRPLEMTMEIVLESFEENDYVDETDALECHVSCEILARLIGNWGPRTELSKGIDSWVESFEDKVPDKLLESARKAVDAISGPKSGLAESWAERKGNANWKATMRELSARLTTA